MSDSKQLAKLTELIEMLVSRQIPAIPAIPAIPPVIPANPLDHDLLTKLDAKVDQIQLDVTTLKNQGSNYVSQTEHTEVCKIQTDHETRLRRVEKSVWQAFAYATGAGAIIGIVIDYFIRIH